MIAMNSGKRKAISPILATVILIAITIIAAVAISGFVFGIFSTYMVSPAVYVSDVICSPGTCTITLTNSGTASALTAPGGVIQYGGTSSALACPGGAVITGGGGSITYTCTFTPDPATPGMSYMGSVGLSNGAEEGFAGTFT